MPDQGWGNTPPCDFPETILFTVPFPWMRLMMPYSAYFRWVLKYFCTPATVIEREKVLGKWHSCNEAIEKLLIAVLLTFHPPKHRHGLTEALVARDFWKCSLPWMHRYGSSSGGGDALSPNRKGTNGN